MAIGKLSCFRQSLNIALAINSPEVGSVPSSAEGLEPLAPCVCDLGHLGGLVCDLGHLGGQSNCRQRFSHSADPQHLAIAALYALLAS